MKTEAELREIALHIENDYLDMFTDDEWATIAEFIAKRAGMWQI